MQKPRPFLLQDYLRGSPLPPIPLPAPCDLSSPLPSSLSPALLTSLSSYLLSSAPLPSDSLTPLLNSISGLVTLPSPPCPSHLSLLLGSISFHFNSSSHFGLLASLFQNHISLIASNSEFLPEALAGLGYALSRVEHASPFFTQLLSFVFIIWQDGRNSSLENGIMVLKLVEWLISGFIASNSVEKITTFCSEITDLKKCVIKKFSNFAVLMANFGALRAIKIASSRYKFEFDQKVQKSMEFSINFFAKKAILDKNDDNDNKLLINCVAMGLTRCGQIGFDPYVVECVCQALINEIFPLKSLFGLSIENPNEDFTTKLKEHMNGMLFKEAGSITGSLFNQYSISDEKTKELIETLIWDFSNEVYTHLKRAILTHKERSKNLVNELEKITEAAFLMIVVISNEISKHRLNPNPNPNSRPEVAVRILVAFSCVEYSRRVRLQEYTDSVRRAVVTIQDNFELCAQFVDSMPGYDELTGKLDSRDLIGEQYHWSKDDVQTARVLFYLRVVPTCISLVPASIFTKKVVPTMFLYMHHPNEKVTRASHSVLISFVSSSTNEMDERLSLKEQLAFYYIQRALEGYPAVTPFEGLASGVAALVRNLQAGSPATFYCVHSLVSAAKSLCEEATKRNSNVWKSWDESSEPCKKVADLSLLLLSLVDVQVLPYLLRELAGFISQLPTDGQDAVLGDMYRHVAESDDVTRKPVLVSWLQSLSYLSSQIEKNSAPISSCL